MPDAYARLLDYLRETGTLRSCVRVLSWDQEVNMPRAGAELRASQLKLLAGLIHARHTAPELGELIEAAGEHADGSLEAANVREARRDHERAVRVPRSLVEELAHTNTIARRVWEEARARSDFAHFLPWLEKLLDIARRRAEALGYEDDMYDALVETYEPGETVASLEAVFAPLREALPALLRRIVDTGREPDRSVLGRCTVPEQERLVRRCVASIGFDLDRGRIDVAPHPFCSGAGPTDVRLTTRYDESDFGDALFSALHEAGHGLYEQGLLPDAFGTPMGEACSFGIHESQSRLWENFVGRSRGFWDHVAPLFDGHGADALRRAVNAVLPSLIRVDSDEVTYNLHIFVRFELERAMLSKDLLAKDLPGAWNEAYGRMLGVTPPDDAKGCLQDIHWAMGAVGYFPTYTLGNVYAAQIFERARADLGDLEAAFRRGEFGPLREWLTEKIHRRGKRFPPRRLVEEVTGAPPDPLPLVRHLEARYGELYGL